MNTCLSLIRRVIDRYGLLEKNSRVLVGVSGGVDSTILLYLLSEYNDRYSQRWKISACHIDAQFPGGNASHIKKLCKKVGVPCIHKKIHIHKKLKDADNACYVCARARRKKLLETAESLGIFQVALAHHTQDVAETLFLNMIYNGELSTLVPKQSVIRGRFFFIRPLYFLDKTSIKKIAEAYGISIKKSVCPYFSNSKRKIVRDFLEKVKRHNPDTYKNIFRSLFHINRPYMP